MSNNQSPEPLRIEPALLTIPQVCAYLNIARPTLYKLNTGAFGLLPVKLLGCRKVLYSRTELEAYVRESTAQGKLIPRQQWQSMRKDFMK
jgi:predicted DNA-binding transcriptional regulator AlpA